MAGKIRFPRTTTWLVAQLPRARRGGVGHGELRSQFGVIHLLLLQTLLCGLLALGATCGAPHALLACSTTGLVCMLLSCFRRAPLLGVTGGLFFFVGWVAYDATRIRVIADGHATVVVPLRVIDADSGRPVQGAVIRIRDLFGERKDSCHVQFSANEPGVQGITDEFGTARLAYAFPTRAMESRFQTEEFVGIAPWFRISVRAPGYRTIDVSMWQVTGRSLSLGASTVRESTIEVHRDRWWPR